MKFNKVAILAAITTIANITGYYGGETCALYHNAVNKKETKLDGYIYDVNSKTFDAVSMRIDVKDDVYHKYVSHLKANGIATNDYNFMTEKQQSVVNDAMISISDNIMALADSKAFSHLESTFNEDFTRIDTFYVSPKEMVIEVATDLDELLLISYEYDTEAFVLRVDGVVIDAMTIQNMTHKDYSDVFAAVQVFSDAVDFLRNFEVADSEMPSPLLMQLLEKNNPSFANKIEA